jgi:hypothetical protein
MSVACRLGFATRLPPAGGEASSGSLQTAPSGAGRLPVPVASGSAFSIPDDESEAGGAAASADAPGATLRGLTPGGSGGLTPAGSIGAAASSLDVGGASVAVVVDSEATSYLMMGALSAPLKRHAVSLFEGGRVSGADVVAELIRELWASYEAGQVWWGPFSLSLSAGNACVAAARLPLDPLLPAPAQLSPPCLSPLTLFPPPGL